MSQLQNSKPQIWGSNTSISKSWPHSMQILCLWSTQRSITWSPVRQWWRSEAMHVWIRENPKPSSMESGSLWTSAKSVWICKKTMLKNNIVATYILLSLWLVKGYCLYFLISLCMLLNVTYRWLTLQTGHDLMDEPWDYLSRLEQFETLLYSDIMKWDRVWTYYDFCIWPIIRRHDYDKGYDQLWKLRTIFDELNKAYVKFYNASQHLAVEVIFKFKHRVIFRQCVPKNRQ